MSKPCPATWELTLIFIRKGFLEREEIRGGHRIDGQEREKERESVYKRETYAVCAHMYRQLL